MNSNRTCLGRIFVAILAVLILIPSVVAAQGKTERNMDDALLLMISGQSHIHENYAQTSAVRLPGLASLDISTPAQGASPQEINEQKRLADAYSNLANSMPSNPTVQQHLVNKAKQHSEQAEALAQRRRAYLRSRHNVFSVLRRKIAEPLTKGTNMAFRGLGKLGRLVVIVARDEVIIRAKQIIRAKVQDLVDIGRGKLDTVMSRIARKFGFPAAELLREFIVTPAFNRLQAQLQRNVEKLTGQHSNQETASTDSSSGEAADDEEYNPDFSNVDEEGDTGYDDGDEYNPDFSNVDEEGDTDYDDDSSTSDSSDKPTEFENGHVFDVHEWFTAASCKRFNGNMPAWMENTFQSAAPMFDMGTLTCHWTTDLRESQFGCNTDGENCALMPGRVEIEISALPTIADAQARFRNYTTNCSQDETCQSGLTELVWQYAEAETAYQEGIAYFSRLISLNDNVIIEIWWGGSQDASDIYPLLNTARVLVDPLQR